MGCCFGDTANNDPARFNNAAIEAAMKQSQLQDSRTKKLLLLGAGESGKSTLFKQCRTLYGQAWETKDYKQYELPVHKHILYCAQILAAESKNYSGVLSDNIELVAEVAAWRHAGGNLRVTPEMAEKIAILWADPGIQSTYKNRSQFQLYDHADYFLENAARVASEGYQPTYEDILRVRRRTSGIVQMKFTINGQEFLMVDVGGQQNERQKWIHSFAEVNALLWVCAISGYDQTMFEDSLTNRVADSLASFENHVNTEWFEDTSVILFLNKRDLFLDKIKQVPLTVCFPEYEGSSYDDAIAFFKTQFKKRLRNKDQVLYPHVTCATDQDQMLKVFKSVRDVVIRNVLQKHGFY